MDDALCSSDVSPRAQPAPPGRHAPTRKPLRRVTEEIGGAGDCFWASRAVIHADVGKFSSLRGLFGGGGLTLRGCLFAGRGQQRDHHNRDCARMADEGDRRHSLGIETAEGQGAGLALRLTSHLCLTFCRRGSPPN
jgi:hypothetical protein